jgi:replicative DNA helicase
MLSSRNALSSTDIANCIFANSYQENNFKRANKAYGKYSDNLFFIESEAGKSTDIIKDSITKHIANTGQKPVVILDYLQMYLADDIDKIIYSLKSIAREFKLPVVVISSVNRNSYNQTANLSMFRSSGNIEFAADCAIAMQHEGVDNIPEERVYKFINDANKLEVRKISMILLKNRFGQTGNKISYHYNPKYNYFWEAKPDSMK